jgi:deazaflavin-dependent oxidoreductase (nitroreductase family)
LALVLAAPNSDLYLTNRNGVDQMTESFKTEGPDWQQRHLKAYRETEGKIGHFVDFTPFGGPPEVPCLILETTGRKSGTPQLLPLIYGEDSKNFVIVASKGGAPKHPAWFLNLESSSAVKFQVGGKKFSGKAVVAPSTERLRLYDMMTKIYPAYAEYQQNTDREIPVVLLKPEAEIDHLD